MQSLKPRCEGCGTANALDAVFCQECGVGLNIDQSEETIPFETDGNFVIKDSDDNSTMLFESTSLEEARKRVANAYGISNQFDYGIQTKKNNSLDHLRDDKGKFVVKDKRLDFRSNQIPDWEFPKKQFIVENDEDIAKHGRIEGRNVLKIKAKNIEEAMEKADWKVPILSTTSNITPQPPYSEVIERDVRKGILEIGKDTTIEIHNFPKISEKNESRKRPEKQNPKEYITIRKNYNSKFLWLFPITIWSLFTYFSLFY